MDIIFQTDSSYAYVILRAGLAITFGFLVRPAALGLAIFMAVAIKKAHWEEGFFLSAGPDGSNGMEYCLALLLMSVALLIGGAGGGPAAGVARLLGGGV